MMLIQYLEAYNIYPEIIKLWQQKYGDRLLPIQELAVKQYHILDGKSLLLFSPTSSGKTFVAEMAAIKQAGDKKKVIFAVPLKSLAEEKFRQFQSVYSRFGIRTVISTRDRSEYDFALDSGNFDIAVMVYEKFNSLLIKRQDILDHLGLVVIDELQMLGDESRGTDLDLLLTKLILRKELTQTNPEPGKRLQLLGLSAVLGNADRLARWLDIPLLVHSLRPVELRKGILYNGVFEYQEHNSKQIGEEIFFAPQAGSRGAIHRARLSTKKGLIERPSTASEHDVIPAKAGIQASNFISNSVGLSNPHSEIRNHQLDADPYNTDQIIALVQYLAEIKKESSIVFVPQKRLTRLWANSLSDKTNLAPASTALAALDQLEESLVKDELKLLLQHGIAYHTADLSPEFRQIIEFYFRTGEIRVVIATSTLGQGVNLAAKNAVIVPQTVKYRRQDKLISQQIMDKSQFENCSGRVGRFGIEKEFGRAFLVAGNKNQRLTYWLWYIDQPFEKLATQLPQENLESLCLNLIASGWCRNVLGLTGFISRMYHSARQSDTGRGRISDTHSGEETSPLPSEIAISNGDPELKNRIMQSIEFAQQWGLVTINPRNELAITDIGQATAMAGISFDTARHFRVWLESVGPRHFSELELLLHIAFSPDAAHFLIPFTQKELQMNRYRTDLMKLVFDLQEENQNLYITLLNQTALPAKEKLIAIKKTLILYHWITGMPTPELERKYRLYYGALNNLGAEFSWLTQSLSRIAQSAGATEELVSRLTMISDRLRYGVKPESISLARLDIPGLGRMRISRLVQEGYDTPDAVSELELEPLSKLVSKPVAERLQYYFMHQDKPELVPTSIPATPESEYDTLHLLGIPVKKRTALLINNQEIALPNRQYQVLLKLALAGLNPDDKGQKTGESGRKKNINTSSLVLGTSYFGSNGAGWVHRDELDAPDNFGRNISRLRCSLRKYQKRKKNMVIDNDQMGYYRLNLPPEHIKIEYDNFNQHWNKEFAEILEKSQTSL